MPIVIVLAVMTLSGSDGDSGGPGHGVELRDGEGRVIVLQEASFLRSCPQCAPDDRWVAIRMGNADEVILGSVEVRISERVGNSRLAGEEAIEEADVTAPTPQPCKATLSNSVLPAQAVTACRLTSLCSRPGRKHASIAGPCAARARCSR